MGSTTLISSAFTALLNCAEVGRRNRISPKLPISVSLSLLFGLIWFPNLNQNLLLQLLGFCLGGEALDDLTLSVNEKLGKVPFDSLA